jgi:hypoxanthine phosphoribosyltransferase
MSAEVLKAHKEYKPHIAFPDPRTDILVSEGEILQQLPILGKALGNVMSTLRNPMLIWLADGAELFATDLIEHIPLVDSKRHFEVAVVRCKSREGVDTTSKTEIQFDESEEPFPDVFGKDVIIGDDVLDTGKTVMAVVDRVAEGGGTVTDIAIAAEKPIVDRFKGKVRTHSIPQDIRIWPLILIPALWVYKYGMDNGDPKTEKKDREGREIRVKWTYERGAFPHQCRAYERKARARDVQLLKVQEPDDRPSLI